MTVPAHSQWTHRVKADQVGTQGRPVRFLLVSGRPLKEPIAWYGPIVMNTRAELRQAFEEFEKGTFVKKAGARA